jgi:hypothetical protein
VREFGASILRLGKYFAQVDNAGGVSFQENFTIRPFCAIAVVLAFASSAVAQAKKEPLVLQVKGSIDRAVRFLKGVQRADGSWELNTDTLKVPGGATSLAVLALLNAGVPVEDSHVKNGLAYLRRLETPKTYVRALQTMVFVEAGQVEDRQRISDNITWLIDARVIRNGQFSGWNYTKSPSTDSDNSNTQYALLGLWAGRQAGIAINREIWKSIRDYYLKTQATDGGWIYSLTNGPLNHDKASLTMTTAGLCGILIAGMELNIGRKVMQPDGTALDCGIYEENKAAAKALNWIGNHFTADDSQMAGRVFYNLYGLERTGRLTGQRFLGGHDWYREGCQYLVREQRREGSWWIAGAAGWDHWPTVSTSFALLFLSKGRTPILISKLAHGVPVQLRDADTDWNNDRNDVRNLVAYSGDALFKRLPLAWQVAQIRHVGAWQAAPKAMRNLMEKMRTLAGLDVVLKTEEVPVDSKAIVDFKFLYMHGRREFHFENKELERLSFNLENGGLLFADACCGQEAFDKAFRVFAKQLFPKDKLMQVPADDVLFSKELNGVALTQANIMCRREYGGLMRNTAPYLEGVKINDRWVLLYSKYDIGCALERHQSVDCLGYHPDSAFKIAGAAVLYSLRP